MSYEAGTAFLQIVPSFQGVVEKISDQAAQWGELAGKAFAETFEESTKGISLGPSDSDSTEQGASAGGAFADGFRARVEAALKALPSADVTLNDAEAEAKLDDLRARLETLRDIEIGVDVTDTEALSAVEIIKGELDELAAKSPTIRVQVDAGEASAELAVIGAEADAAGSGASSLGEDAGSAGGGIGALVGALAVLATALIPIGGLAAGALATLPALLAGAASGLGALKLGFSGISGALSAYTSQQKGAGAATASTGQSATSAAEQALSAAQQEQSAAQAVASAREQLANAETEAADSVHRAQEQLVASTQALAQAEQAEENAQVALTQARIDAANAITNLNDQVADGALAIQQATLDQASAQAALTAAQQTPGTSPAVLEQAQLTAAQAAQHLQDLTDQQQQLTQAQAASTAAGVDGSTQVISATQALGQAQQTVATDQQSQTDASNALLEAQATATQKVSDEQTTLAQAISSQTETLQRVALEAQAAGASSAGAAPAVNTFAQAMAGLTPAGRSFVNFVTQTLLPMYDAFKSQVQEALLPGITLALIALLPVFQTIAPFIIQAATGIAQWAQGLAGILSSGPGLFNLSTIFEEGAGFMQALGSAALDLVPAFLTIGAQAAPIVAALGAGIDHIVQAFARWVANGGFETFLRWLKQNGPSIVSALSELFKGFGSALIVLLPFGEKVLGIIGAFGKFITFASPVLSFLLQGAEFVFRWISPVGQLITMIQLLVVAFSEGWPAITGAVSTAFDWLNSNVFQPLGTFFTQTIPGWLDTVGGAFSTTWGAIQGAVGGAYSWIVTNVFQPLGTFFTQTIPGWVGTVLGFFAGIPGAISGSLSGLFSTITNAFGNVSGWVNTNIIQPIVGFFQGLGQAGSALLNALDAIGNAIKTAFKTAFNAVAAIWNATVGKVNFTLPGWIPGIGGDSFGFPQMPTFHDGGLVPGPAGSDVPAILQAGEVVLSRNDVAGLRALPAAASDGRPHVTQDITVTAFDPRTAAVETVQRAGFALKTRGY